MVIVPFSNAGRFKRNFMQCLQLDKEREREREKERFIVPRDLTFTYSQWSNVHRRSRYGICRDDGRF
ncbi:hypothetical protein PUN28_019138 [Cardiocondyla obscurior]|uniref:Uncharacterized protein n=1 Tax=Cardiocondyla obscurior TaxID=286306 RepID=A0AAW2EDL3_9HYME